VKDRAHATGFGWVAFAFLVTMAGTTLPTPLYPLCQNEFGLSGLTVTVIFATYAAGVIAALILFGAVSDRVGRKRTLVPGLVAAALSAVCCVLANGLPLLLLGMGLLVLALQLRSVLLLIVCAWSPALDRA